MESSRYNIYIEDYPRNGYILIYNLYTRQIACVKERDPENGVKCFSKDEI